MSNKHDITPGGRRRIASRLGVLAFSVSLGIAAVRAQAPSIEERLQALESELRQVKSENDRLRRDLGLEGRAGLTAVRPAGKEPVLTINGLIQGQAEFGDRGDTRGSANDRFRLRRVRFGAAGRFLEEFDFKMEGEYAGSAATLTDGFVNWSHFSWANVRIGQFKTPFGYEFLAADPKLFTIERSFGTDRLTLNRQVGAQVSGDFAEKRVSYAVGLFNGNGANTTTNDNENFNYVGRVSAIAWEGRLAGQPSRLTAGVNGFISTDTALSMPGDFGFTGNAFTGKRDGLGADSQFRLGGFDLWGEYLTVRFRPNSGLPASEFRANAWYLQAAYFVVPSTLQLVTKFDTFDPNDKRAANETDTWTFGANWYLKGDDLKLQAAYLYTTVPAPLGIQRQLMLRVQTIF